MLKRLSLGLVLIACLGAAEIFASDVYCGRIMGRNQYNDLLMRVAGRDYALSFEREQDYNSLSESVGRNRCVYGQLSQGFESWVIVVEQQVLQVCGRVAGQNQYGDVLFRAGLFREPLWLSFDSPEMKAVVLSSRRALCLYGNFTQGVENSYFLVRKVSR